MIKYLKKFFKVKQNTTEDAVIDYLSKKINEERQNNQKEIYRLIHEVNFYKHKAIERGWVQE